MPDAEPQTKPGSTLPAIGSYKLVQQLGSGGMSSVFRAIHAETGHVVAVKVLPRSLAKNPTLLQRFLREAKSAESLEHPNIVSIYDRGTEDGRYYLVLEYVAGGDLHDRVRTQGPLGVAEALEVIKAVCHGLRHAASRGLIHRDIKPANLLMTPEGKVKIIDLGLALQVEQEDERVTRDGTTVGTVDYMAPEQARDSRATSIRSDIYSLGCTFYYLLSGSPPYPGGDVTDKLRRHAAEAPPDVRTLRPEVPEILARVIQRMMAKRSERRYGDYDTLIAALEGVKIGELRPAGQPLYALIDDDDDEGEDQAYTLGPGLANEAGSTEESATIREPRPNVPKKPPVESFASPSLADLADLDEDEPPPRPARRRPATAEPLTALVDDQEEDLGPEGYLNEGDLDGSHARPAAYHGGGTDTSLRDWIVRGLMAGVAIVAVIVGIHQLIALSTATPEAAKEEDTHGGSEAGTFQPDLTVASTPTPAPRPVQVKKKAEPPKAAPAPPWVEPADIEPGLPPESALSQGREAQFLPDWARSVERPAGTEPPVVVRRLESQTGRDKATSLLMARDQPSGTIELADDGPFFEHDIRPFTRPRVIRARKGFRPIVVLEPPTLEAFKTESAYLHVDGEALVLEGLDLVVDARDTNRPAQLTALFLVRGGELTLRDCTVTVHGDADHPFTFVRLSEVGAKPGRVGRVRLERTLVRGGSLTGIHFADGPGEVAMDRSAMLCGDAPGFDLTRHGPASPAAKAARRISLVRDVIAARKSVLELQGGPGGPPPVVRAIGCLFARVEGSHTTAGFVDVKEALPGSPKTVLDLAGELNTLTGWPAWLTAGPGHEFKVPGVVQAREVWSDVDEETQVLPGPWPVETAQGWTHPALMESLAPDLAATLRRMAAPSPFLWEKTLGSLPRLTLATPPPARANAPSSAEAPKGKVAFPATVRPDGSAGPTAKADAARQAAISGTAKGAARPGPGPAPGPGGRRDSGLDFDARAATWNGDLGRFLHESVTGAEALVRIRVQGSGVRTMTPVRLPAGVTVEITVVPPEGSAPPLVWSAAPGSSGMALIEASGSDVTLTGARFLRDGGGRLEALIGVEDGRLVMTGCWLFAPWEADPGGGRLVRLRSSGTKAAPLPPVNDLPSARLTDCLLMTGGDAIDADLGAGVVALANCALAGRFGAFVLRPQNVSRSRFAADLWLDRCTLVTEHSFVHLGPWPGKAPGPDRPWLVSSNACAFLDVHPRGRGLRQAALLRADLEAYSQGAILWQADRDAYDVAHFFSAEKSSSGLDRKPDVQREWVEQWGRAHIRSVSGPTRSRADASGINLVERRRSGELAPEDLALNPASPKARYVGADLSRLGLQRPPSTQGQRAGPRGTGSR
jgi:serine/threonine-protein kinase